MATFRLHPSLGVEKCLPQARDSDVNNLPRDVVFGYEELFVNTATVKILMHVRLDSRKMIQQYEKQEKILY
jgi:hypothetical protein